MRPLVDADFNAASREISMRLDIYLDETPLEVTKQNYLIDSSWLEEGSADSSNPFGAVSSNELSLDFTTIKEYLVQPIHLRHILVRLGMG